MTTAKDWADWTLLIGKGKGVVTVSWKLGEVALTVRAPDHTYITIPLDTIQADAIASTLFRAAIHEDPVLIEREDGTTEEIKDEPA